MMVDEQEKGAEDYSASEGWHRAIEQPDVMRPFPEVLAEHMEAQGIEDLEKLWERFQASGETPLGVGSRGRKVRL
jgi:hypothetical protein